MENMTFLKRLAACLVTGTLLATSAAAADSVSAPVKANETYTTSVTFTDAALLKNGNQYVLLVSSDYTLNGSTATVTIDESTLTYIDQAAAANGSVTFSNVNPKSLVKKSIVLLGGEFNGANSPIVIGYIDADGNVQVGAFTIVAADTGSNKDLSDITFTILSGTTQLASANVNANGSVDIAIPDGTGLTIVVERDGYVPMTINNYSSGKSVDQYLKDFRRCAGDVDGSGVINEVDIAKTIPALHKKDSTLLDVNKDGIVSEQDIALIISNLHISGRTYTITN